MKISDFKVGEKAYKFTNNRQPYTSEVEVFKIGKKLLSAGWKLVLGGRWEEQYMRTNNPSDNFLVMVERPTVMLFKSMDDIDQYKNKVEERKWESLMN